MAGLAAVLDVERGRLLDERRIDRRTRRRPSTAPRLSRRWPRRRSRRPGASPSRAESPTSSSSRRIASARSTPASPAVASAQSNGRPTSTPRAPSASGDGDVEAAPDAAVDPDLGAPGDGRRRSPPGRRPWPATRSSWRAPWLLTTIAVHAVLDGQPGVLGGQDALEHERQRRSRSGSWRGRPRSGRRAASSIGRSCAAVGRVDPVRRRAARARRSCRAAREVEPVAPVALAIAEHGRSTVSTIAR